MPSSTRRELLRRVGAAAVAVGTVPLSGCGTGPGSGSGSGSGSPPASDPLAGRRLYVHDDVETPDSGLPAPVEDLGDAAAALVPAAERAEPVAADALDRGVTACFVGRDAPLYLQRVCAADGRRYGVPSTSWTPGAVLGVVTPRDGRLDTQYVEHIELPDALPWGVGEALGWESDSPDGPDGDAGRPVGRIRVRGRTDAGAYDARERLSVSGGRAIVRTAATVGSAGGPPWERYDVAEVQIALSFYDRPIAAGEALIDADARVRGSRRRSGGGGTGGAVTYGFVPTGSATRRRVTVGARTTAEVGPTADSLAYVGNVRFRWRRSLGLASGEVGRSHARAAVVARARRVADSPRTPRGRARGRSRTPTRPQTTMVRSAVGVGVTGTHRASDGTAGGDAEPRSSTGDGSDRATDGHGPDTWLYGWALGYAAVGAASLLVPLYAIDLGAGAFVVSLIAATAALAGVPGAILWGRLVTRTRRRRPFILVALGLSTGVFVALPFLGSPWTVLAANAALWFVIAAAAPVLNVIVVEGYQPRAWAGRFGLLNHYQGYGWLAGLVAGGVWSAVGGRFGLAPIAAKRLFFAVSAAATLVGILVVVARYPEAVTTSEQRFRRISKRIKAAGGNPGRAARAVPYGPTRVYWALRDIGVGRRDDSRADTEGVLARLHRRFSGPLERYLAAATLFFAGFSAFFGPLPAYLVDAGYATDEVFALFILSAAASAAAYTRAGTAAESHSPLRLQAGALALRAGSFPVVAVAGAAVAPPAGLVVVGLLFAVIGVSWAVIAVTAAGLVTELAPASARAEALGVYTAVGSLGGGVGSVVGGGVADGVGYLPAFVVAGAAVVVAAFLAVDGVRRAAV